MEEDSRILELEKRIAELQADVEELKKIKMAEVVHTMQALNTSEASSVVEISKAVESPKPVDTPKAVEPQKPVNTPKPVYPNYYENADVPKRREHDSLESFIGKNAMAVGASFLIFIAMIMFAFLIVPILGDTIKIIAMFVFSFAFIGVGEFSSKRKGPNKWNTALIGCGTGAVFLSLFITYSYFEAISFFAMYILLVIWAACLCYLGNKKSIVFAIIGQTGIFLASAFSASQMDGIEQFVLVIAMIVLSESSYLVTDFFTKNYWSAFASWLGQTLSLFVVTLAYCNDEYYMDVIVAPVDAVIIVIIFALIMYTSVIQGLFVNDGKKNVAYLIQSVITILPLGIILLYSLDGDIGDIHFNSIANMLILVASGVQYYLIDKYSIKTESHYGKYVAQGLLAAVVFISNYNIVIADIIGVAVTGCILAVIIQLLAFVYSRYTKNRVAKFLGLLEILIMVVADMDFFKLKFAIIVLMLTIIIVERIFGQKGEKHTLYDNVIYVIVMSIVSYLILNVDYAFDFEFKAKSQLAILCITLAVLQVTAYIKRFAEVELGNGKFINPMFTGINVVICAFYSFLILFALNTYSEILYCALLILLCSLNVKKLLSRYTWAGAYVAIKYTLLCYFILKVHKTHGIVFSGVFLCIAIISIILGFKKNYKAMRLYGLILSIISVIKLVLVDVIYDELLYRAFGFLICGMLCFAISYIYNKLDKQEIVK